MFWQRWGQPSAPERVAPQPETVVKLLPTKLMFLMSIEPSRKLPAMSCDTCSIFSAA
jgi:hypothetical protein